MGLRRRACLVAFQEEALSHGALATTCAHLKSKSDAIAGVLLPVMRWPEHEIESQPQARDDSRSGLSRVVSMSFFAAVSR